MGRLVLYRVIWYELLYKDGTKTITKEYLDKIDSPIALAYWFMDDGTHSGVISTHCFSEKEVDLLIDWMANKWNIICTKQKQINQFTIYIINDFRFDFEKLIFPYVLPSMYYKLKYSKELSV